MSGLPWPGKAVVVMQQPDGTLMAFPFSCEQLDMARSEGAATWMKMSGWMLEGREWSTGAPVPFEQAALPVLPPQIGGVR